MKYIVNKINESLKYKIILIKDGRKHKGKNWQNKNVT